MNTGFKMEYSEPVDKPEGGISRKSLRTNEACNLAFRVSEIWADAVEHDEREQNNRIVKKMQERSVHGDVI